MNIHIDIHIDNILKHFGFCFNMVGLNIMDVRSLMDTYWTHNLPLPSSVLPNDTWRD